MDFDKILDPLVNYLNIFIEFLSLGIGFMAPFIRSGTIEAGALAIFFVGYVFGVVIAKTNDVYLIGGAPGGGDPDAKNPDKVTAVSLLILVPLTFVTVILFEVAVLINGLWSSTEFGTIHDTTNAALISAGLLAPFTALSNRVNDFVARVTALGGAAQIAGGVLQMLSGLFQTAVGLYAFRLFAEAHGVPWTAVIVPAILFFVLFLLACVPFGQFIIWKRMAHEHARSETVVKGDETDEPAATGDGAELRG